MDCNCSALPDTEVDWLLAAGCKVVDGMSPISMCCLQPTVLYCCGHVCNRGNCELGSLRRHMQN